MSAFTGSRERSLPPTQHERPTPQSRARFTQVPVSSSANDAAESVARKIGMVVELLLHRSIRFSVYQRRYDLSFRNFQRDIQQLRRIGNDAGFALSTIKQKELVELTSVEPRVRALSRKADSAERLIASAARALGEPIVREIGARKAGSPDDFFIFATPQLVEGTAAAEACQVLRDAATSPDGRAGVRFQYPSVSGSAPQEREVEPYHVAFRSGVFYLVGYDRERKAWRLFALHRMLSKPVRIGTCTKTRVVPAEYLRGDALGFLRRDGDPLTVTVELSALITPSTAGRRWQTSQTVEYLPDGRSRLTFTVSDLDEVIRWTLGLGAEARVISPPEAVAGARATVLAIERTYAG